MGEKERLRKKEDRKREIRKYRDKRTCKRRDRTMCRRDEKRIKRNTSEGSQKGYLNRLRNKGFSPKFTFLSLRWI